MKNKNDTTAIGIRRIRNPVPFIKKKDEIQKLNPKCP